MNPIWSEWSQWAWDGTRGCWYRGRQDIHGNVQWEYDESNTSAPRGDVEDLAASFNNVSVGDDQGASYTHTGAYTYGAPITAGAAAGASVYGASAASSAQPQAAFHGKGKSRAVYQPNKPRPKSHKDTTKDNLNKHSSRRKPGKNDVEDSAPGQLDHHEPFYTKSDAVAGLDYSSAASTAAFAQQQSYSDSAYGSSPHDPSYVSGIPQGHSPDAYYGQVVDPNAGAEVADPERHTRPGRASGSEVAHSTSSVAADTATEDQESEYHSTVSQVSPTQEVSSEELHDALSQADPYLSGFVDAQYSGGESSSMAAAAHTYTFPAHPPDSGRDTPKPFAHQIAAAAVTEDYPPQANTSETYDYTRQLGVHDGYVVERSSKFQPGMVFKILWCEPLGNGGPNKSEAPTNHVKVQQDGRTFYQGLRRFIVVANDEGHCTCVPILTYERQACLKRGVKPLKHGIVYQAGKTPRMLPNEPRLGFDPVRVYLTEKTEGLSKESRVNYAKLTPVEHNFRVYFIGYVDPNDFEHIVRPAIDHCWQRKKRHTHRD